jgi:probable HAF family extracellular repeat protein
MNIHPLWISFAKAARLLRYHFRLGRLIALALLWASCVALPSSLRATAPTYKITDLGVPSGYSDTEAVAINNSGQIAGNTYDSNNNQHAFLYSNGTFTVIPTPSGFSTVRAVGMNNSGEIIGVMLEDEGGFVGFVYANGSLQQLGYGVSPNAINDSGVIVGDDPDAFISSSDLGVIDGYGESSAVGIDSAGQVLVGEGVGAPSFEGGGLFLYSGGSYTNLGVDNGYDFTMNAEGMIVGELANFDPFLYVNGTLTDLTTKGVYNDAEPAGINSAGTIIGQGFIYMNSTEYSLFNLNISGISSWNLDSIDLTCINDSGQISGGGYLEGDSTEHLMLLTPTGASGGNVSPAITTQPGNQTVLTGNSATFTTAASGTPAPTYHWQISTNGGSSWTNITSGNYSGQTTNTLTLTNPMVLMSGDQFRVIATNSAGSATSNAATLTVNSTSIAPSISLNPTNQSVNAEQDAGFSAQASGSPAPTLIWQISTNSGNSWSNLTNSVTFAGVNTTNLVIMGATTAMNGDQFELFAYNSVGSATSNAATLTVNSNTSSGPTIISQPGNLSITVGQSAFFDVIATGSGPLTYQWQFNNGNLSGATSSTFTVNNATTDNAGNYTVVVSLGNLSVTSNPAVLTVNPAPVLPSVTTPPANVLTVLGQSANFTVAASGTGPLFYQWQLNGKPIKNAISANYTIGKVVAASAGNYTVVITNTAGSVTSPAATLTLGTAPKITGSPDTVGVALGQSANFSVVVANPVPAPSYQWQISTNIGLTWSNITNLTPGNYSGVTNATLIVNNPGVSQDSSYFQAVVTNSFGSAISQPAALFVFTPPAIAGLTGGNQTLANGSALSIAVGSKLTFAVTANGTFPTYQWAFNGKNIKGATKSSYTIAKVAAANAGNYTVSVTNYLATVTSSFTLNVLTPPALVTALKATSAKAGSSPMLKVVASGNPIPVFTWSFAGGGLPSNSNITTSTNLNTVTSTLNFTNATVSNTGTYKVVIINSQSPLPPKLPLSSSAKLTVK